MKTLKSDWLIWIFLLMPFVFIAAKWNLFPDQVPTHFNMEGRPDQYSGKAFGLFLMPGINIALYFFYILIPMIDPRKKNFVLFANTYKTFRIILHIFLTFIFFLVAFFSLGYPFNISIVIFYSV